jgi:hypothetical protein
MSYRNLRWQKKKRRPRTLYDVDPRELKWAVRKMCRELGISLSLLDRYDLYKACMQERENEIDKRLWMLEA